MSLYSRYSESSISVSYFSRSSALIGSVVLRSVFGTSFLSPVRRAARPPAGAQPSYVDEGEPVLTAGALLGQSRSVERGAVALVFGESVAGMPGVHLHHE